MKRLTRESIDNLVPYPPGKPIEELERELGIKGSIKLASNENPLGPSPLAVQAILDHVPKLNRYPDGSGFHLKSKLSAMLHLPQEQIIIGNGSNELIELLIRTFLMPGEQVIQASPTFLVYEKVVAGAGGRMVSIPLKDFKLDLEAMADAIIQETKILFINNPNNPTGSAVSKEDMERFLKRVPGDVIVVLDEAYIDFVSDPEVARGLDFMEKHALLVSLRTFSKLYGLAGLRIGYGFGPEKLVDYMNRVRQPFNVNSLAQAGAAAALEDKEFVSRTLNTVREGLSYLYHELDQTGLEYIPTQTNFFLIRVPLGGRETYERMLKQGVIVRAMDAYGLDDYIRINVGLPEENERFVAALRDTLT
ncbi:MAG: histidinol-phosphate transaminase [Deltaproteobacteria bacterium]